MTLLLTALLMFQSSYSVTLAWDANTESNLAGYHVYRAPVGESVPQWQRLTTAPITQTTFTDATPVRPSSYHYAVTAVDTEGIESDLSEVVRASGPPPITLTAPANITIQIVVQ